MSEDHWIEKFIEHLTGEPNLSQTHLFELLRVLRASPEALKTITQRETYYTFNSLVSEVTFIDGKEYRIEIREITNTLSSKMKRYPTVQKENCTWCGNPWFFDKRGAFECTTCHKHSSDLKKLEIKNLRSPEEMAEGLADFLVERDSKNQVTIGHDTEEDP